MRLPSFLENIHNIVVNYMVKSWIVENLMIAKITAEDNKVYDCIYCTIIRIALIFSLLGGVIGFLLGRYI